MDVRFRFPEPDEEGEDMFGEPMFQRLVTRRYERVEWYLCDLSRNQGIRIRVAESGSMGWVRVWYGTKIRERVGSVGIEGRQRG